MKIPDKIEIMGEIISVVHRDDLMEREMVYGSTHHHFNEIHLNHTKNTKSDILESTFFEELVHSILDKMREKSLNGNEKFVGIFSNLLYQALKDSMK